MFKDVGTAAMPFNIIGAWFEACLAKSDASGHGIDGIVRFSGYYSPGGTYNALEPLAREHRKEGDMCIYFDLNDAVKALIRKELAGEKGRRVVVLRMRMRRQIVVAYRKVTLTGRDMTCLIGGKLKSCGTKVTGLTKR